MLAGIALALLAVGCGRVGFDPRTGDGGIGGADGGDGADAQMTCTNGFGPWGNVTHVDAANASTIYDEWQPALHPSGLLLVFQSNRPEGSGLYAMTRASQTDAFGPARELTELYGAGTQDGGNSPAFSADGQRLSYIRYQTIGSGAVSAPFLGGDSFGASTPEDLPYPEADWELTGDGLELFYTIDTGDADLGHGTRATPTSSWTFDTLTTLNTAMEEGWPSFDEPRQELYYEAGTSGGTYIAVAKRNGPGQPFGAPTYLMALGNDLGDPEISIDGRTLVYCSTRSGGGGSNDLYIATRSCL